MSHSKQLIGVILLFCTVSMASTNRLKGFSPSELKRIFDESDLNHDTNMDLAEMLSPISKINTILHSKYNSIEIEYIFIETDANNDKKISYNEFQQVFAPYMSIFDEIDISHDSFIDLAEVTSSLSKINSYLRSNYKLHELEHMFNQFDTDKDNKLNYNEYLRGFFNST